MQYFADDFSAMTAGNLSLTAGLITAGYSELENSGTASNVAVIAQPSLPVGLQNDLRFPASTSKQVLKFTLAADEIQARLLWSGFPAGVQTVSLSWWEYRAAGNLGGEKFCRVGNFVSGPGSNRGVDSIITLGQVSGTTLIANSGGLTGNMHDYGDHSLLPGISGFPGLHHFEAVYALSTGTGADGSVSLYRDGALIGQATGLQFFDTSGQAATGIQLWDMGGWSSTGGGTEGTVTYPIIRYICATRIASSYQGVWLMAGARTMIITGVRTLTTALAAPALASSVAGSTATLNWTSPAPTGQSVIAGFRVYRSSSLSGAYTQVGATLPASQLSLTDSLPGTQFYKVEAFDQFVTGSRSAGIQCNPVSGTRRKWHPGHYGASGGTADASDNASTTNAVLTPGSRFYPEIDDMLSDPWIVGYAQFAHWGTFESQGLGIYDWRMLDAIFNRCKSKGKQYVLRLVPVTFSGGTLKPGSNVIPPYLQSDPQYGPSPIAGSYGWWGPPGPNWSATTTYQPGAKVTYTNYNTYNCVATALGASQAPGNTSFWQVAGGAYTAALYRPAVAARYAALGVAIANHIPAGGTVRLADDPFFEAITDQEDSAVVAPANARNTFGAPAVNDSSYSDAAYTSARQSIYLAWQNAMPTVNIAPQTKFMFAQQPTYDFLKWQMQNGFASGSSDTAGQTYYNPKPPGGGAISNSWGQTAYFGLDAGGQDWRPTMPALYDVEGPNMGQKVAVSQGATPLDLCNALNQTVKATHAFWCYIPQDATVNWRGTGTHLVNGVSVPNLPVTTVLRDNPLIRSAYPSGYPQ